MGGRASLGLLRVFSCTAALIAGMVTTSSGQAENPGVKLTWSHPAISTTKLKNREFHGPFGHEDLTVTCEQLGKHDFLEISFDLFIMSSWDGSNMPLPDGSLEPVGPDYFRLGIQGGPTLLYHTFSNIPLTNIGAFTFTHQSSKAQNYPSQVPGERLAPHSGASEFNTLGFEYEDTNPHPQIPMDATYRIHFVIPHSEAKAVLEMNGLHLQDPFDENWGIADLVVRTLTASQVRRPADDSIDVAFRTCLDAGNSRERVEAFQTLIDGMDSTADWIDKNVKPISVDKRVQALVVKLQSGKPEDVTSARRDLALMGAVVEPYLRDARIASEPKVRADIDTVLETIDVMPIAAPNARRAILATRVLEIIGTRRAMNVRNNLTTGIGAAADDHGPAAAGPTSRPWEMHFGDSTVSLVAVGEFTNEPSSARWWTPDGMPTAAPPVVINVGRGAARGGTSRQLAIAYRVTGPSIQNPRLLPSITMATGGTSAALAGEKDGYFLFSFYNSSANLTAQILTRFGNGPSLHKAVYDLDPAKMTTTAVVADPEFEIYSVRQINPAIFGLEFVQPDAPLNLDWDAVLITKDGQKVIHESQNGQGRGMLYHYRISATEIKQIIFDSRSWERLELQNVSLMPGQQTEPVVVKPPPVPPGPPQRGRSFFGG